MTESFDGKSIHLKNYHFEFNDKYITFMRGNFDVVKICKEIEQLTLSEICVVTILKESYNTYYTNNPKVILCESNPLYYRSFEIKKIVISNDVSNDPRSKPCEDCPLKTMCAIPIIYKNIVYGQLLLGNKSKYTRRTIGKISDYLDILFTMIISMEEENMFRRQTNTNEKFFSTISHEIRTPIHSIVSIMGLLRIGDNLTDIQHEYIERITESCEDLVGTVSDAITFEKIKSGFVGIVNESFDLEELLTKISNIIQYKIQKKKLQFNIHIQPSLAKSVYGDPKSIKQVIINLLVNSIKYTESGSISLKVNSDGENIQFAVSDTGCGIPKEHISKIFDEYYQVDRNAGGMGLGLALCKRLVQMMGGDITALSTVNKGSKFTFTIPLPQEIFEELSGDDKYSVLVVTPIESQRIQLREYFTQWKVEYDIMSSFNEARKVLSKDYNVFMIDVTKNFGDAISFLRNLQINHASSKIIALNQEIDLQGFDESLVNTVNKITVYNSLITKKRRGERRMSTSLEKIKICIVEDDVNSQFALSQILLSLGIHEENITCVDNADTAVRIITHSQFNLAFIDCKLKGNINGITATKLIKQNVSYLRIYGVTADLNDSDKADWLNSGLEGLLIKPFNIEAIKPIISSI